MEDATEDAMEAEMDAATSNLSPSLVQFQVELGKFNEERKRRREQVQQWEEHKKLETEALKRQQEELASEKLAFEEEKRALSLLVSPSDVLELNAGGVQIACKRDIFLQFPDTYLSSLFSGRWEGLARDSAGRKFLDVNGRCFECLVDHLRDIHLPSVDAEPPIMRMPDGEEDRMDRMLKYFQIDHLMFREFAYTGEIIHFVVPASRTYTVVVAGASGGSKGAQPGGRGAVIEARVRLEKGERLQILVGQQGVLSAEWAGGGGGSFLVRGDGSPLLVAGGGGGAGADPGKDASLTEAGVCGGGPGDGAGGQDGEGGRNYYAAGAGFLGDAPGFPVKTSACSFRNGGAGTEGGGFGGGGCGNAEQVPSKSGGGGGGYSGGGAGTRGHGGGGGGSFLAPLCEKLSLDVGNTGNGVIKLR